MNPELETLVGRMLLGEATPGELERLAEERARNPRLQRSLELLAQTGDEAARTPILGVSGSQPDLPEYERPQELAAKYAMRPSDRNRILIWGSVCLAPMWGNFALQVWGSEGPLSRTAMGLGVLAGLTTLLIAGILIGWPIHARRQAIRIAEGGAAWRDLVAKMHRLENFNRSRWPTVLLVLGSSAAALGFALLAWVVLAGEPLDLLSLPLVAVMILLGGGSGLVAGVFARRMALRRYRS